MHRSITLILISLLFLFNLCPSTAEDKQDTADTLISGGPSNARVDKHALIIAVGRYAPGSGWDNIGSTNDIPLIKNALKYHSFPEQHIKVLQNEEATKEGIEAAFQALILQVDEKDIVVFHFAGHGQRVQDDNGDESDGYDEAIAPYDSQKNFSPNYQGQQHIRDDELGKWLYQLREKLGIDGNVLVGLDACYSGTGTRDGMAKVRGASNPMAAPGYSPAVQYNSTNFTGIEQKSGENLASMVVISGAQQNEPNRETLHANKPVGSLSLALSRQLQKAEGLSYLELYERIREDMAGTSPRQTPQIEGDIENYVFSGETNPYVTASIVVQTYNNEAEIEISAGLLAGIREGATVALYENRADPEKSEPVNTGKVVKSNVVFATVRLDKRMNEKNLKGKKVILTGQGTGENVTTVYIDMLREKEFGARMKQTLSNFGAVELVNTLKGHRFPELILTDTTYEAALEKGTRGNELNTHVRLYDLNGQDLLNNNQSTYDRLLISNADTLEQLILEKVKDFHTSRIFTGLETNIKGKAQPGITIEVVPIDFEWQGNIPVFTNELPLTLSKDGGEKAFMKVGQAFAFRLKNNAIRTLYYNILQMDANRKTEVIIPNKRLSAADRFLRPGEELIIKEPEYLFAMDDPIGPQQFKVIAADRQFFLGDDLEQLLPMNSRGPRNLMNNFSYITVDNTSVIITK
jgi:hypothetical protein